MHTNNQKTIGIAGGGWVHNIGNAFIQFGSIVAVKKSCPEATLCILDINHTETPLGNGEKLFVKGYSYLPHVLSGALKKKYLRITDRSIRNDFKIWDHIALDYYVDAGVLLSAKYIGFYKNALIGLQKKGTKIIINGGSGLVYTPEEIQEVRSVLAEIKPYALISRDAEAFAHYHDLFEYAYEGIDAGFFLDENFDPVQFDQKLKVFCFDNKSIPASLTIDRTTVITHHSMGALKRDSFVHPNTFFSETPENYLHLYANCSEIHANRVHACLPVLVFGGKARLYSNTPRAKLFEAVGCGDITNRLVTLDRKKLEEKKARQVALLKELLNG